ncbi:hypothetical protein GDI0668 [Gluconacetobacter diazotrophicus PA1 5]|uniref:Uncharacterized protein n=1 Tax=Gluconacetobacter diazotrophicus (strain ATCC 49037 / DSM 5601 / CCUG 37298 / CIP 103539 / LMG 7603 / PAl5) TaxID=272568 RepID=A9H934_GLUDA|nr:hypothetical protein GDI0668 [Gluconacetobacter diazotrophicus PA1 5]
MRDGPLLAASPRFFYVSFVKSRRGTSPAANSMPTRGTLKNRVGLDKKIWYD